MTDTSELDLEERVRLEIRDQVAWVTIDNPERGNALTPGMRDRLAEVFGSLNGQFYARAAVVTAIGKRSFCTGADLSVPRPPPPPPHGAPRPPPGGGPRARRDAARRARRRVRIRTGERDADAV